MTWRNGRKQEIFDRPDVKQPQEDQDKRDEPWESKVSRVEEARRIANEYVEDLREIIRKLRSRLFH